MYIMQYKVLPWPSAYLTLDPTCCSSCHFPSWYVKEGCNKSYIQLKKPYYFGTKCCKNNKRDLKSVNSYSSDEAILYTHFMSNYVTYFIIPTTRWRRSFIIDFNYIERLSHFHINTVIWLVIWLAPSLIMSRKPASSRCTSSKTERK